MWVGNVFAGQNSFSFVNFRVVLDNFDATSTASGHGFQDPKSGWVPLTLALKLLIVIRKKVTHWRDNEIRWMLYSKPVHVSPEQVFPTKL